MSELVHWLTANPIAGASLAVALSLLLISVVVFYVVAFVQGREISFWPPKIGPRPLARAEASSRKDDRSEARRTAVPPTSPAPDRESKPPEAPPASSPARDPLRMPSAPTWTTSPRTDGEGGAYSAVRREHLRDLSILRETGHSVILEVLLGNERLVLKSTRRSLSDLESLVELRRMGAEESGRDRGSERRFPEPSRLLLPLAVWQDDSKTYELYPFIEGTPLDEVVARNRHRFRGLYLSSLFFSLLSEVKRLHDRGILHRDLTPSNLFVSANGAIVLIDPSFCCREDQEQVVVATSGFSPPEQLAGRACKQSDWYTLAASVFYLSNGRAPDFGDPDGLRQAIQGIHFAHSDQCTAYGWVGTLLEDLLAQKVDQRPSKYSDFEIKIITSPLDTTFDAVLDLGGPGFVFQAPDFFEVVPRHQIQEFLEEHLARSGRSAFGASLAPALQEEARQFLDGRDPWLRG